MKGESAQRERLLAAAESSFHSETQKAVTSFGSLSVKNCISCVAIFVSALMF